MKHQELDQQRQKSKQELLKEVASLQHELMELRLKKKQATDLNVRLIGHKRKQLAQLLTLVQIKD